MLSQDDYKLYTGTTATTLSDEDWKKLVNMLAMRLAGLLCLESLPTDDEGDLPSDLAMLLANFIFLVLEQRGSDSRVSSKRVRNYSITYSSSENPEVFARLVRNYGDIINNYSNCGSTLGIECNTRTCCGRF